MIVIAAGVVMNAITAIIMFVVIAMIGYQFPSPVIGDVVPDSPAANARITWTNGPAATTAPATATSRATAAGSSPATTSRGSTATG